MEPNSHKGVFIVIEGPDGSGKGFQTRSLARWLRRMFPDRRVLLTHEPWEGERYGRWIRKVLRHIITEIEPGDGKITASKFQRWYVENRIQHQSRLILAVLEKGGIVVCDRERLSTLAYGHAYGVSVDEMMVWHKEVPTKPDQIIYLDTSAATCIERMKKRGDNKEFFEDNVQTIIEAYRYIMVNVCTGTAIILVNNERKKTEVRADVRRIALSAVARKFNTEG